MCKNLALWRVSLMVVTGNKRYLWLVSIRGNRVILRRNGVNVWGRKILSQDHFCVEIDAINAR